MFSDYDKDREYIMFSDNYEDYPELTLTPEWEQRTQHIREWFGTGNIEAINLTFYRREGYLKPGYVSYALEFVAEKGHLEAVNRLLEIQSRLNKPARYNSRVLANAVLNGHEDVVNRLLKEPAIFANAIKTDGLLSLTNSAARSHHLEVLNRLLTISAEEALNAYTQHFFFDSIPYRMGLRKDLPIPCSMLASNEQALVQVIRNVLRHVNSRNPSYEITGALHVESNVIKILLKIARENNIVISSHLDVSEKRSLELFHPFQHSLFDLLLKSANLEEIIPTLVEDDAPSTSSSSSLEEENDRPTKVHQRREGSGGIFFSVISRWWPSDKCDDDEPELFSPAVRQSAKRQR